LRKEFDRALKIAARQRRLAFVEEIPGEQRDEQAMLRREHGGALKQTPTSFNRMILLPCEGREAFVDQPRELLGRAPLIVLYDLCAQTLAPFRAPLRFGLLRAVRLPKLGQFIEIN